MPLCRSPIMLPPSGGGGGVTRIIHVISHPFDLNPTRQTHLPPELSQLINPNPCLYYYLKSIQENLHKFAQFDKKKQAEDMWMAQFCNNNKTFSNFSSDSPIEKGDRRQMMTRQGLCCLHLSPCFLSFTAAPTPTHTPTGSSYPLKQRAVAIKMHSTVFRVTWNMEASYLADI